MGQPGRQPAAAHQHGPVGRRGSAHVAKTEGLDVFSDALAYARTRPTIPTYPEISQPLGQAIVKMLLDKATPAGRAERGGPGGQRRARHELSSSWPRPPSRRRARSPGQGAAPPGPEGVVRARHRARGVHPPRRGRHPRPERPADGLVAILSMQSSDLITPGRWVGLANYKALDAGPRLPLSGRAHARLHGPLRAPSIAGGLGAGAHAQPRHPVHRDLPHDGLRPVRRLRHGPGRPVLLHLRPALRHRQHGAVVVRRGAAGLLRRQQPGAPAARAHRPVERARLLRRGLPRRAAGRPAGAGRGGGHRRRTDLGTFRHIVLAGAAPRSPCSSRSGRRCRRSSCSTSSSSPRGAGRWSRPPSSCSSCGTRPSSSSTRGTPRRPPTCSPSPCSSSASDCGSPGAAARRWVVR